MKKTLHKIIPSNFNNLLGLAGKLLVAKNAAGRAAMWYSLLGLLLIPLDAILGYFERKLYLKDKPKHPLILVCGPPRSGTTLVAQVLMKHLPVYYFNNLTSIFPNAPITANKLFGWLVGKDKKNISFKSLYGRTAKLGAPNDALYLWDRWTDVDRATIPKSISPEKQQKMQSFFYAVEQFSALPLVNKNNALNTYANLVAPVLDTAYFICLDRNPVFLAQSQLIASDFIHGNDNIPYGVHFNGKETKHEALSRDAVAQVCEQVKRHHEMMQKQQREIGSKRFIIVPYEDFCKDPAKWVCKIAGEVLHQPMDPEELRKVLPPFKISNKIRLDKEVFQKIEHSLHSLKYSK
ncbi:MAG: sulfotransferase [Flavobacteriaceae bacterium]